MNRRLIPIVEGSSREGCTEEFCTEPAHSLRLWSCILSALHPTQLLSILAQANCHITVASLLPLLQLRSELSMQCTVEAYLNSYNSISIFRKRQTIVYPLPGRCGSRKWGICIGYFPLENRSPFSFLEIVWIKIQFPWNLYGSKTHIRLYSSNTFLALQEQMRNVFIYLFLILEEYILLWFLFR